MIARLALDVDVASRGRVVLGIGIGDNPHEFEQLGLGFPPVPERQRELENTIPRVLEWCDELSGGPLQQPHPPILIAGGGEAVTLRQVAAYADACNFGAHRAVGSAFTLADVQRKLDALRAHCAAANRPFDSVLRSHSSAPVIVASTREGVERKLAALPDWMRTRFESSTIAGTPEEVTAAYRSLVNVDMRYFIASVSGQDLETIRLLGEQVIPALQPA
jgi:alkanesulfonate monooxygenase SsuD/methylene tetrahydromethanopterin reductase-like flavin-dependent oxidoreductase (luciferase family)